MYEPFFLSSRLFRQDRFFLWLLRQKKNVNLMEQRREIASLSFRTAWELYFLCLLKETRKGKCYSVAGGKRQLSAEMLDLLASKSPRLYSSNFHACELARKQAKFVFPTKHILTLGKTYSIAFVHTSAYIRGWEYVYTYILSLPSDERARAGLAFQGASHGTGVYPSRNIAKCVVNLLRGVVPDEK